MRYLKVFCTTKVDWLLGARLAGEVKPAFQEQTVNFVEDLDSPNWLKVELLGRTSSEFSIAGLLKVLEDANSEGRGRAAAALGNLGADGIIPALLKALEDSDPDVRQSAAEALGQQLEAEGVIPNLLEVLQHPNFPESFKATKVLQKLDAKVVIPSLSKALEDSNPAVCWWAAYALGSLGVEAALPSLLKALEGSNSVVRGMAAEALEKLGTEASIPELLKALEDSDSDLRQRSAEVLGQLGAEAAIPALLKALENPDNYVRQRAARASGKLSAKVAIPALLKALEDLDSGVRGCAAEALGKLGVEDAIPALFKAIEDSDIFVRQGAIYALGKLGVEAAIPALLRSLEDSYSPVRGRAAEALGQLGVEVAIPALVKALEDSNNHVRRSAARALGIYQGDDVPQILPCLLALAPTQGGEEAFQAIAAIQNRCQFYNYEIWQAHQAAQKDDQQESESSDRGSTIINNYPNVTEVKQTTMNNSSKYNFPAAQKVQIFEQVTTYIENNHPTDSEVKTAIADLTLLLTQLQTQHPQVTTESQALTILDAEFTEIQQSPTHSLVTLRQQLLNPERHLQAIKTTFAEVVKHYLEGNCSGVDERVRVSSVGLQVS